MYLRLFIVLLSLLNFSCTSNKGPEAVLRSFVDYRFNNDMELSDFEKYFSGALLEDMKNIDDQVLGYMNQVKDLKKKTFRVNFKRCEQTKCYITYTLSYLDDKKAQVVVKVKKIAEMSQIEGSWKIVGITDVKSHYDYKKIGN